jgi:biotin carboxyl carrier protein
VAEWLVDPRADGTWLAVGPGGITYVAHAVTGPDDEVWVFVDGQVVVVADPGGVRTRPQSHGPATLDAPMPAQVTAVLVAPGDVVIAGAPLVLLEAMKMELPLKAPFSASVIAIHCNVGDRVSPGRTLVDLTPIEEVS